MLRLGAMMKLYERIDNMSWREFDSTPGAICGDFENASGFFARDGSVCECALIPAPDAEAAVRAWERILAWAGAQKQVTQASRVAAQDLLLIIAEEIIATARAEAMQKAGGAEHK